MSTAEAYIALNRFGVGARPGEAEVLGAGAREALLRQAGDARAFVIDGADLPTRRDALDALSALRETRREARIAPTEAEPGRAAIPGLSAAQSKAIIRSGQLYAADMAARVNHDVATSDGFAARLVWFWSNHFTVSSVKPAATALAGVYEREAIRASMTSSFADMHFAVMRHAGMLLYLDQAQSIGPNSVIGRRRGAGLNENLAREALELHTLGADGGYTQADVTEFARALTGWTIVTDRVKRFLKSPAETGDFVFVDALHEPGARTVLGRRYAEDGEAQARAILGDLARRPQTARRIAQALCRHFIADDPPTAAVAAVEKTFLETDGDLPSVHRALVARPEAWVPEARKFKTPNDFVVSALRLFGVGELQRNQIAPAYALLGMRPLSAPSPKGWPDVAEEWATPDAVMKRLEWSVALGERLANRTAPAEVARRGLGPAATERTLETVRRAESAAQGVALTLMSPEFQRR